MMLSDVKNYRTDPEADQAAQDKASYDARILTWLQSRPEVGVLNSGKFYVMTNDQISYVEPFTLATK